MLHHRFIDKFDELEFEKNARVANALKLCQEEKEALEKVIADAETKLKGLKRDATNAATEMGALRIEVANLEDAVVREEQLVAARSAISPRARRRSWRSPSAGACTRA